MKTVINRISLMLFILVIICTFVSCQSTEEPEKLDVSVMISSSTYDEFNSEREYGSDEAVFIIHDIPEENIFCEGEYKYILSTNEKYVAIIHYTGKKKTIKIPETIKGKPVVCVTGYTDDHLRYGLGEAAAQKSTQKIILPNTIVAIGPEAFCYFRNLRSISFSSSLTHIYEGAFDSCSSLESLQFPNSLVEIERYAFAYCTSLKSITFSEGLEFIGERSFIECENLYEISLPKSLLYVGYRAFEDCECLNTVNLSPNTLLIDSFDNNIELLNYEEESVNNDVSNETSTTGYIEDFNGYTLRIFDVGSVNEKYCSLFDNEEFKKSIDTVSKLYNCSIVEVKSDDYLNDIKTAIKAGKSFCDIAILPADQVMDFAINGMISPWIVPQSVDFDNEWWDKSTNNKYNVGGIQFAVSGDFNLNNFASQMCYVYNRKKLDSEKYYAGMNEDTYSSMLMFDVRNGDFGKYGDFTVWRASKSYSPFKEDNYVHDGGICGSIYNYYRTMLAGQGIEFYKITEDKKIDLTYETGYDYIGYLEGIGSDSELAEYRDAINGSSLLKEVTLMLMKQRLMNDSIGPVDMSDYLSCDESIFLDGKSTFMIARVDEIPDLMKTGIDIGIVPLPGGVYTSLIDTPTLAFQPLSLDSNDKNIILLDAISKYCSETMISEYIYSIIGKSSNSDYDSTYSYNEQMIKKIFERPYCELDLGITGNEIQYLYYKYMMRYDLGRGLHLTDSDFFDCAKIHQRKLGRINAELTRSLSYITVPETSQKETWAEEYIDSLLDKEYSINIKYIIDIPKIKEMCNQGKDQYLANATRLNQIINAYQIMSGDETQAIAEYCNYEDFYQGTRLNNNEKRIIERFFYETYSAVKCYPLSYVQKAFDYLYGSGTIDIHLLSDEISCYVSDDEQYFFMQCPEELWRIYGNIQEEKVHYTYSEIKYNDNKATIILNNDTGGEPNTQCLVLSKDSIGVYINDFFPVQE